MPSCIGFQINGFIADVIETCGTCAARSSEASDACGNNGCCGGPIGNNQFLLCKAPGCCIRMMGAAASGRVFATVLPSEVDINSVGSCKNKNLFGPENSMTCPYQCAIATGEGGVNELKCPQGVVVPAVDEIFTPNPAETGDCYTPVVDSIFSAPDAGLNTNDTSQETKTSQDPDTGSLLENDANCFPGDAIVELQDGSSIRMEALQVGDCVKVGLDEYSTVFMFTHRLSNTQAKFVTIKTSSGASLSLTQGHYIYANGNLVAAAQVVVGDSLLLGNGAEEQVTVITYSSSRGLYNPQTENGNIVVNGIVTSVYTTAVEPSTAHVLISIMRSLYSSFGVSTSIFHSGADSEIARRGLSLLEAFS